MKYISLFKKMSILMSHMSMCKLLYSLVMSLFLWRPQIYSFLDSNSPQVQVSYLKSTFCFLLNVFFSFYCTKFSIPWLICSFSFSLKKQQNKQTNKTKQKTLFFLPLCSSSLPQVEVHKYIPPHGTLSCWTRDISMANIDMKTSIALSGLSLLSFFSLKLLNSLVFCVFRSPVSKYCFVFVLFYVFIYSTNIH